MTRMSRVGGLIIGGGLMVGAVVAIFLIKKDGPPMEVPPPPSRPLKVVTVGSSSTQASQLYPGRVRASQIVDLAFEVPGRVVKLDVVAGDVVKEGDVVAELDPRDYQNDLRVAQADRDEKKSILDKIQVLFDRGSSTERELIEAKAKFEGAEANVSIKQKAVDDTRVTAPFTGRVAKRYVDNFTNVEAKQSIVSLQDISEVEIVVDVPEQIFARLPELGTPGNPTDDNMRFIATFDYLPDKQFEMKVKEFNTDADDLTQTFSVVFTMPAPDGVVILPGMTGTVQAIPKNEADAVEAFALPIHAVPIDSGTGKYFVWKVQDAGTGTFTVNKTPVEVGRLLKDEAMITNGLAKGDIVAAAGAHVLSEGQKVTLLNAEPEASNP